MRHYEGNDRYQFQPWHVKAYRWLRWRPLFAALSAFRILWWMAIGMKPWPEHYTRWQTLKSAWICHKSLAHFRMGSYMTSEEFIFALTTKASPP